MSASMNGLQDSPGHRAAVRTAWVAGVFCALAAIVLAVNWLRLQTADPLDSPALTGLKLALQEQPMSETLKQEIRELDGQLRQEFERRQAFARHGAVLLLCGVVVCVASAGIAAHGRWKLPMPGRINTEPGEQARLAARVRRWASIAGIVIALGSVAWAMTVSSVLSRIAEQTAPSYPSFEELAANWARFRGPGGSGIAPPGDYPTSWDAKTGKGIVWKSPVPLAAPNSPIVWGDRVFLSGATKDKREVYCYDAATGAMLWQRPVDNITGSPEKPPSVLDKTYYAVPTMAADGRRVYAIFANGDIIAFDFEGNRRWARNLGLPQNDYGHASSLLIYRHLVIVLYDQAYEDSGKSKLMALHAVTGRTVWETRRPVGTTWSTPIIARTENGDQIITLAKPLVISYEAISGKELWRAELLDGEIAPAPVFANGLVFVTNSGAVLAAIKPDGSGDVTASHVVWQADELPLPDITSPVTNGELIFLVTTNGELTCCEAATGKKLWEHELDMPCYASPSIIGDRLLLVSEKGAAIFCKVGRKYEELGRATLGEKVHASPAFHAGRIYIRGGKNLYCIGKK